MLRYASLVLLALFAVLAFSPTALAQINDNQMMTANATATAIVGNKLPGTGGP